MYKKNKNLKKIIFSLFLVLFIIQILFFNEMNKMQDKYTSMGSNIQYSQFQNKKILINNVIRNQQRLILQSIKQSWINYTTKEEKRIIKSDDRYGTFPIYSNENNQEIFYDNHKMYKKHVELNYYDIYSRDKDELLLEKGKPNWNTEELENILNLLAAPIKVFGNNGGIIIFDSYSGQVFLDTTPANRTINNPDLSIFEDFKNPNCKNVFDTKYEINNCIKSKKDSDSIEEFIYLFNEKQDMGKNLNDFNKYKLGDYNRQFVEKMILPYESFGFDGQPMQLTVLLIADEQDIFLSFKDNDKNLQSSLDTTMDLYSRTGTILISTIFITMIFLVLTAYMFKYNCNENENLENKTDERWR